MATIDSNVARAAPRASRHALADTLEARVDQLQAAAVSAFTPGRQSTADVALRAELSQRRQALTSIPAVEQLWAIRSSPRLDFAAALSHAADAQGVEAFKSAHEEAFQLLEEQEKAAMTDLQAAQVRIKELASSPQHKWEHGWEQKRIAKRAARLMTQMELTPALAQLVVEDLHAIDKKGSLLGLAGKVDSEIQTLIIHSIANMALQALRGDTTNTDQLQRAMNALTKCEGFFKNEEHFQEMAQNLAHFAMQDRNKAVAAVSHLTEKLAGDEAKQAFSSLGLALVVQNVAQQWANIENADKKRVAETLLYTLSMAGNAGRLAVHMARDDLMLNPAFLAASELGGFGAGILTEVIAARFLLQHQYWSAANLAVNGLSLFAAAAGLATGTGGIGTPLALAFLLGSYVSSRIQANQARKHVEAQIEIYLEGALMPPNATGEQMAQVKEAATNLAHLSNKGQSIVGAVDAIAAKVGIAPQDLLNQLCFEMTGDQQQDFVRIALLTLTDGASLKKRAEHKLSEEANSLDEALFKVEPNAPEHQGPTSWFMHKAHLYAYSVGDALDALDKAGIRFRKGAPPRDPPIVTS
jgi:hypothetical protein